MTFHFINTKDQSPDFGSFVPFAFATVIVYYQVADRVCIFSRLFCFFSLQVILGFSRQQLFNGRSWLYQITSVAINYFLLLSVFHNFNCNGLRDDPAP